MLRLSGVRFTPSDAIEAMGANKNGGLSGAACADPLPVQPTRADPAIDTFSVNCTLAANQFKRNPQKCNKSSDCRRAMYSNCWLDRRDYCRLLLCAVLCCHKGLAYNH